MTEDEVDKLEAELTDDERDLLDQLADKVAKRSMIAPALFFLESVKPLGYVSSQLMHFFRPLVQSLWANPVLYTQITKILERRGSLELLVRRLEARG